MRNECGIISDLLPLYVEGMVNDDTAAFVRAHLEGCQHCRAQYERMKTGEETAFADDAPAPTDEAAPIRELKKRLKLRQLRAVGATVLIVLLALVLIDILRPVAIRYGTSELYSEEEMADAVALIDREFSSWKGCRLYSIDYAGDELCEWELAYCNTLAPEGVRYADCIVFYMEFRSPIFGGGAWNAGQRYHWSWYLARTAGGAWELLTWGAP